jgi:hypothetical protein
MTRSARVLRRERAGADGAITVLVLARPEVRNAIDDALLAALHGALDTVEADGGLRGVVLAGAGGRAFSAGMDLRERAGFTERLGHYLAQPAPKKAYSLHVGKKTVKPQHLLLGDPIEADGKGNAKDVPLALHYIELLAKIGALHTAPVATKVLSRLLKDSDENGVWHPKGLRSLPKGINKITYHSFPLATESKSHESRQVDVTFRIALIAKHLGWQLEMV